jgi:hypothetical protein
MHCWAEMAHIIEKNEDAKQGKGYRTLKRPNSQLPDREKLRQQHFRLSILLIMIDICTFALASGLGIPERTLRLHAPKNEIKIANLTSEKSWSIK